MNRKKIEKCSNFCVLGTHIGSKFGLIVVFGKSVDHGLDHLIMNLNRIKNPKHGDTTSFCSSLFFNYRSSYFLINGNLTT